MSKQGAWYDQIDQDLTANDLLKQKTARDELFDNSLEASLSI